MQPESSRYRCRSLHESVRGSNPATRALTFHPTHTCRKKKRMDRVRMCLMLKDHVERQENSVRVICLGVLGTGVPGLPKSISDPSFYTRSSVHQASKQVPIQPHLRLRSWLRWYHCHIPPLKAIVYPQEYTRDTNKTALVRYRSIASRIHRYHHPL